jgi:hypothetical protein
MQAEFFSDDTLREVLLHPVPSLKLNAQKERRIRLNFAMVCTEENLAGAPDHILTAFGDVAADENGIQKCIISTEFERINIAIHHLPDKPKSHTLDDCTIRSVTISRKAKENSPNDVVLHMVATVPYSKKLWSYLGDAGGTTVWVQFEQTQAILQEEDDSSAKQHTLEGIEGGKKKKSN